MLVKKNWFSWWGRGDRGAGSWKNRERKRKRCGRPEGKWQDAERWKSGEKCKTLFFPFFQKQEPRMLLDLCFASSETSEPMNKLKALLSSDKVIIALRPSLALKWWCISFILRVLSTRACNTIWLSTNHEINSWTRNTNNSEQRRLFTSFLKLLPPSIWLTFGSFSVPFILKGTTTSMLQITWNALLSFKLFCKRSQEVDLGATSSVVKPHIPVCKHSITLLLWFFVVY